MATFGSSTSTPNGGLYYFVSSGKNQYASLYTAPNQPIQVTALSAYFSLYSGSGTCYVCMWSSGGTLLASASVGTVGAGTQSPGAQAWRTATLSTPVLLSANQQVYLGWWSPGNALWTTESSGSCFSNASGSPGSFASHGGEQGNAIGAYATYSPAGISWGDASGNGVVHNPVAVKFGDPSGSGVVHTVVAVWVPNGAGVKRIW